MIARIGTFAPMPPEVAAESQRNLSERFLPALRAQEGFIAGYWLSGAAGQQLSITLWESEEAMGRGGAQANATPLLPGQDPSKIPSPHTVEVFTVTTHA
jgi:hypothetical protein